MFGHSTGLCSLKSVAAANTCWAGTSESMSMTTWGMSWTYPSLQGDQPCLPGEGLLMRRNPRGTRLSPEASCRASARLVAMMAGVDVELDEVVLTGGRVARGIVRVGETVRRPMPADSDYVHGLLAHLEHCGFVGAPRFLGVDSRGREIVSYIEGDTLPHNGFRLSSEAVVAGALLVRRVHDLTAGTEF